MHMQTAWDAPNNCGKWRLVGIPPTKTVVILVVIISGKGSNPTIFLEMKFEVLEPLQSSFGVLFPNCLQ